jgi:hypothetical protein
VLREQRRQSGTFVVLAFLAFSGAAIAGAPLAYADVLDGTLTVVVNRDDDGDGSYDDGADPPQPGIEIAVTDPDGGSVRGITDGHGQFVVTGSDQLTGGRYLVTAAVPPNLSELTPVASSKTFAAFSTAVDLRGGNQTIRMGVASTAVKTVVAPAPQPSVAPSASGSRPPRFAVGDTVWQDIDRSGRQDPGEPPAAGISVQLLNADGKVIESTVSSAAGRFAFDDLAAGTYAVRFAGVPSGFRLTATGSGDPAADSDPDYTGTTPPFTLGMGKPQVRAATAADTVSAAYIHADIDAGITALRYAIGDRVWLDLDADGARQSDEPPASATVSLIKDERVLATTTTDADGHYCFTGLDAGDYRVRFELGEHRRFTARNATSEPTLDSDPDPVTGTTPPITVGPGAASLMPAADLGVADADLVNATVSAGLVGAYAVGDLVWRDDNGNGVLDSGEPGLPGIRVELLDEDQQIVGRAITTGSGRFSFDDLVAGSYRLRFVPPGKNLVFTSARTGTNPAVDSDAAGSAGVSRPVVLGDENPADTTVDAGLTSPANLTVLPVSAGTTAAPVDTQLSSTGGVAVSIPIAGLALVISGLSCLLAARRSPLP